jgi:hypothetical protein
MRYWRRADPACDGQQQGATTAPLLPPVGLFLLGETPLVVCCSVVMPRQTVGMRNAALLLALLITSTGPAMSQMRYQNSGRPWIDSGRADYDEESDQFADTRLLTQVWLVLDQDKEVLYWTRVAYTDRHIAYLKSKWPNWGKGIDDRRPMGPYLVECSSASGSVSTVQMEQDWTSPVFTPIGKGFGEARVACRSAGFRTTW